MIRPRVIRLETAGRNISETLEDVKQFARSAPSLLSPLPLHIGCEGGQLSWPCRHSGV